MTLTNLKHILIAIIYTIIICTTAHHQVISSGKHISDTSKIVSSENGIVDLPFGCRTLIDHKFPKQWQGTVIMGRKSKSSERHTRAFDTIYQFYFRISRVKSIKPLKIYKRNYIFFGDYKKLIHLQQHFKAKIKFRLPNIGPYECYYESYELSRNSINTLMDQPGFERIYSIYGNILLYHPITKEAIVISAYNDYSYAEPTGGYIRYFYIDRDKKIQIFEAAQEEAETSIDKIREITIQDDGRICVKNIKY